MKLKVNWLHVVLGAIALLAVSYVTFAATPTYPTVVNQITQLALSAPTKNTDGTALTNFAGYKVYHKLAQAANYDTPVVLSVLTTKFSTLTYGDGDHLFRVTAINTTGQESGVSPLIEILTASVTVSVFPNKPASPITVKVTS